MPSVERSICPRATSQWTNCFYNYGRIHCACTKRPYIHFRFKMWRHHRVPPPRFRLRRGNSAIRPWIRVILRTFHCACAKRPYLTFRSKIWRHHRVSRPRFPARRENLGDLRTFKADIGLGLLNICMGFQDLLAKICGFGEQNRGRGSAIILRYWPLTNSFFLWGSYACANFGENPSRTATVRLLADGQIHTLTYANRFLPRCMECRRGLAMRILSVCLSVCHTRELWQNSRKICPDFYTIRKIM